MGSLWKTRKLLLGLVLAVTIFSVFAQSVGAPYFFDDRVSLKLKSDPPLRAYLQSKEIRESTRVNVLLVFSRVPSPVELAALASLCRLQTFTGHVATVNSPIDSLPKLANLPFVARIAMPRMLKPELDASVPEILADQVWNTTKYPGVRDSSGRVVNGTGVIIGFDDVTGIDYSHKDFSYKNGTSKVLYIWDQSSNGNPPAEYAYGNECNPAEIQSQACTEVDLSPGPGDTTGHGTAVAAIAASTGQASNKYFGVAPGASIIEVKLTDGSENYVIDAINYMITKARQLNRPLVIVHSLGDSLGSHDGTEPLELAFTDFVSQGVPIVVASGNDRAASLHVSGNLSPGESTHVRWSMLANTNFIDLWYSTSTILGLAVVTPSGNVVSGPTPDIGVNTVDGNVIILSDMRPSGREWWINVTSTPQVSYPSSAWSFTLTPLAGTVARWDAWTEPGQFVSSNDSIAKRYIIDPSDTIDAPGTAVGVVTVGGYMTRYNWYARCTACLEWNQANGLMGRWSYPHVAPGVGYLIYDSSAGPTRDGRVKPEVVAPAADIATAKASNAPFENAAGVVGPITETVGPDEPDDYHKVWVGTSFAAPHVGGLIALMLQMNPYLSPNEITSLLKGSARQDNFTGPINQLTGSPLWGWGKIDALSSTLDAPSLYSIRIEVAAINQPLSADLTLDGALVRRIPLNQTTTVTLEFSRGGSHTVELTPTIDVEPGTRYVLFGTPWTFSSGGIRNYAYQEQYYLQVNSQYGYVNGTGWYNANSSATASITPTIVNGHQFQGWIGTMVSSSPTVTMEMDSSKEISATWSAASIAPPGSLSGSILILIITVAIIAVLLVAFIKLRYLREPSRSHPSAA